MDLEDGILSHQWTNKTALDSDFNLHDSILKTLPFGLNLTLQVLIATKIASLLGFLSNGFQIINFFDGIYMLGQKLS